jgi:2-(1,2-epoxy-1,2-dihydrophenyl)acetyl-CoA isomerase
MAEIRVEKQAGWRRFVLDRPAKLNAMTIDMIVELTDALTDAEADPACRAIVLTGEGRGFCAGQEIGPAFMPGPNGEPPNLGLLATTYHHEFVSRVRGSRLPVIAAVNGVAAGAGASFALACDIVLAAKSASFVQAFVRIGLVPDSGASFFLTHLVGEARARALTMLGDSIDAETAERWGMIWKVVGDDALAAEAEKLAVRLAASPAGSLAGMKRMFAGAVHHDLHDQLALEATLQCEAGRSADFAEGVQAFLEKRQPKFG